MAGSYLDVFIGTVYIFLLFALFLTAATEAFSSLFKLRARGLEMAVRKMIDDPAAPAQFGGFGFVENMFGPVNDKKEFPSTVPAESTKINSKDDVDPHVLEASSEQELFGIPFDRVWNHPLMGTGIQSFFGIQRPVRPSYVSSQQFSAALFGGLRGAMDGSLASDVERSIASLPQGKLRDTLTTLASEAQGDFDKLKKGVEGWFDQSMDRLTGQYKRFSQLFTFLIGLALAAQYQIDAIAIIRHLSSNPMQAKVVADQAALALKDGSELKKQVEAILATPTPQPGDGASKDEVDQARLLDDARKKYDNARARFEQSMNGIASGSPISIPPSGNLLVQWIGFLVTALAGMLGAPFWFDLLQKLVNMRGTGPKPTGSKEAGQ